jgi:O-acetyl-ADP-ribose deacetylase (regulator of RNase III)
MITYHTDDLLQAPVQALVNTVNTVGVMGKGIALQFKEQFPLNLREYTRACKAGTLTPGTLLVVKEYTLEKGDRIIINFPTKTDWKHRSSYAYIKSGLEDLVRVINEYKIASVAVPPLGCGNGGLSWDKVKPLIEEYLSPLQNVDIRVYEPNATVKAILQQQSEKKTVKLTPGKAIFLYSLFAYEALGESASLFVANKLAYFLRQLGEPILKKLTFTAEKYGPYADGVRHVLYALNGPYLKGLEQQTIGAFEPITLQYDKLPEVIAYINNELDGEQRDRLFKMMQLITGFESALSLEVLATVAFVLQHKPTYNEQQVLDAIQKWSERKRNIMSERYVNIAYQRLKEYRANLAIA